MTDPAPLLAGIDIGGTKCAFALGRADGGLLAESRLEAWASGDAARDLERLVEGVRTLIEDSGEAPGDVVALGVTAPGPLDCERGVVLDAPNLAGWRDVHLAERLGAALGMPVRVENDANAAALAEWRFGAGRGTRSMLFLTMSTGVGGGLILDGALYRGAHFQAGEVGHIPVELDGRTCGCGLRGCLEAYVGGASLAVRMREDAEQGRAARLVELAGGDAATLSAQHWVAALREGDAYARALREEFLDRLSQGLAGLIHAFDPERVVLGTIVRENADLFLVELRERTRARTWSEYHGVAIEPGELGALLPSYAALSVAELAA